MYLLAFLLLAPPANVPMQNGTNRAVTPSADVSAGVVPVDGSGTIAAGGTSQQVFAANPARVLLICQNPITATETLDVNFGVVASATAGSIDLAPGGSITLLGSAAPTSTVTAVAATTGHRFVCKEGGQ